MTALLIKEHEWIVEALELLERVTQRVQSQEHVEGVQLLGLVSFLQTFADQCHHAKEEDVLFPVLLKAGVVEEGLRLAPLAAEHDQARRLLKTMAQHAGAVSHVEGASGRFVHAAHAYGALIRDHIAMENELLFPLAERLLGDDVAKVLAAFDLYESHAVGEHAPTRFRLQLDSLREQLW